ncbi:hypothetical protein BDN72DRAFT_847395 [Pluteus cervinus]|uniref:Uncharacterized protein n=1 Tax=Pluteus cervinus TaxID=181527 RepID=A0ACD3ADZ7_9AGAR|nr:hypothetical protein BDN72DRAFT_847395 [Pluteus cervinus]
MPNSIGTHTGANVPSTEGQRRFNCRKFPLEARRNLTKTELHLAIHFHKTDSLDNILARRLVF